MMGSGFLPGEAFASLRSMLDDPATAQFDHRLIAYAIVAFALAQAIAALGCAPSALARRTALLAGVAGLQAGLGVATLLFVVPIPLALAHQAVALILLGLAVWHWRATQMDGDDRVSRRAPQPCRPGC